MAPNMSHSVMCSAASVIFEPNFVLFSSQMSSSGPDSGVGYIAWREKLFYYRKFMRIKPVVDCILRICHLIVCKLNFFGEKTEQIPLATEDFLGKTCICVLFGAFVYFVTTMIFPLKKCSRVQ